jgi:phosphate transport system substrate-binding protein
VNWHVRYITQRIIGTALRICSVETANGTEMHFLASGVITSINSWIDTPEIFATVIGGAITGAVALAVGGYRARRRLGYSVVYDEAINQGDPWAYDGPAHRLNGEQPARVSHMWEIIYEYGDPLEDRLSEVVPHAVVEPEGGPGGGGIEQGGQGPDGQSGKRPALAQYRVAHGSLVVLELRNVGWRPIREADFGEERNFTLRFPDRRVVHYKIRDNQRYHERVQRDMLSLSPIKRESFNLPAWPMNRGDSFKVLVLLEGRPRRRDAAMEPRVEGTVEGGKIVPFNAGPRSRRWIALTAAVLLIAGVVIGVRLANRALVPAARCASGKLTIEGSTAFAPIMNQVATEYEQLCPEARITVSAVGSVQGLADLKNAKGQAIAMYDGQPQQNPGPQYEADAVGDIIFAIVGNRSLPSNVFEVRHGMTDQQIAQAFTNPSVGHFSPVGRSSASGTRQTFVAKVLAGYDGNDSAEQGAAACPATGQVCLEPTTMDLLTYVNNTHNAIGYAEADALSFFPNVGAIPINGYAPNRANALNGHYTFLATEHLYTDGTPSGLTADLIAFLTSEPVTTQLRDTGFIACADLSNSKLSGDCQQS